MRVALSILFSATVLPSSATLSDHHRRRHRSSSTSTKPSPKPNPMHKPQFPTSSPLLSSSRLDNHQSLTYYNDLAPNRRFEEFLMVAESVLASGVKVADFLASLDAKNIASGIVSVLREGKLNSVLEMLFNGVRKLGIEPTLLFDGVALESLKGECRRLLRCGEVEQLLSLLDTLVGKSHCRRMFDVGTQRKSHRWHRRP